MNRPVILVEGEADAKFIKDFVRQRFSTELLDKHLIRCSGSGNLKKQQFEQYALQGSTSLIIFDADSQKQRTTYAQTRARIEQEMTELQSLIAVNRPTVELWFEIFLLPNNEDEGDLETLLERIINPANQPILDCWQSYEQCLGKIPRDGMVSLTLPARKSKIYSYVEVLHGSSEKEREQAKEALRDYTNTHDWQLTHPAKTPLYEFLQPYFHKETTA
jgi:hypothetical protein